MRLKMSINPSSYLDAETEAVLESWVTFLDAEAILMAATYEVAQLPTERCPDCGSGFAEDWKHIGYRRHLEALPKRINGVIQRDAHGNPVICGGTEQSWNKGHRD
jgi:hypothetical protein